VEGVTVECVEPHPAGYRVRTDSGTWTAATVVIATGACDTPWRPPVSGRLDPSVLQLAPTEYRTPDSVPDGGVLVVGAAASGVQLAEELAADGRDVVLAVGEHRRVPRHYRGVDIQRWLDVTGVWSSEVDPADPAARTAPSLQLIGTPERRSIDLGSLRRAGVRLAGRLTSIDSMRVEFDDSLPRSMAVSERSMTRLLDRIDAYVDDTGIEELVGAPDRPEPIGAVGTVERLDLRSAGIGTVLWATGFRRRYPWLAVPVLDAAGEIRQRRGVTPAPGLYVLGLPAQMRRNSTFIDGVGHDAAEVAASLCAHIGHVVPGGRNDPAHPTHPTDPTDLVDHTSEGVLP
jgi:putative flavoprotein involved in K+ transport